MQNDINWPVKIIFLANCTSPHVRRWVDLLKPVVNNLTLSTVDIGESLISGVDIKWLVPSWIGHLGWVKYFVAGILCRVNNPTENNALYHAHNTSGYGLTALLSGKKYIVTTYGSEIFYAKQKGKLFFWLIRKILAGANCVTATSEAMVKVLESDFGLDPSKIRLFSLGVDSTLFVPISIIDKLLLRVKLGISTNQKVWIINRRVTPLYHTKEVVEAFCEFVNEGRNGHLVVLCGDYDITYLDEIELIVTRREANKDVTFIRYYLKPSEVSAYLAISEFSISTPSTDQLSAAILESLACGTIPILANIPAYSIFKKDKIGYFCQGFAVKDFKDSFYNTFQLTQSEISEKKSRGLNYIAKFESNEKVLSEIRRLYLG